MKKTYIIAEMSANHGGDLEIAKKIIHEAKIAGADCVKIQTYTADTLTINCDAPDFQIQGGKWKGQNLYHLYEKASLPWEWQEILKEEAKKAEIDFLSTAYDVLSADFLEQLGVESYKIASFELIDIPLLSHVAKKQKPMLLSTGMASLEEIQEAVEEIRKYNQKPLTLFKCASAYPAYYEDMDLHTILDLKKRFSDCRIGFSDHSTDHLSAIIAVSLGAEVIEKHMCLSKEIETADSSFSLTPMEFSEMVSKIRDTEKALGEIKYGVKKGEEDSVSFRKSIYFIKPIRKGEKITKEHIRVIRPGYGMKPKYYDRVIGSIVLQDKKMGEPVLQEDIKDWTDMINF